MKKLRIVLKDILKKQIKQILFKFPCLKKIVLSSFSPAVAVFSKPIDEISEQYIVDFLIRRYKEKTESDFSVIDIGAGPPPNYYDICLKYTNHVYCVEPVLSVHDNPYAIHIKKLINYSKKGKIHLFKGVLSEKSGNIIFYKGEGDNMIISSLDPDYRTKSIQDSERRDYLDSFQKVTVESKTYQEYFTDNYITKDLLFVKIDVEGAEGRILTTMNKFNAPKILFVEVQYDTNELKKQIHRLIYEEKVFQESLFVIRDKENFDVLGEFRFNEHSNFLEDKSDLYFGNLILAQTGIIQKEKILDLRRKIYSYIKIIDEI